MNRDNVAIATNVQNRRNVVYNASLKIKFLLNKTFHVTSYRFHQSNDRLENVYKIDRIGNNSYFSCCFRKILRDKGALSRITGNGVCTVTRATFNKFPIEVELKVRYNKIHGGRERERESISSRVVSEFVFKRSPLEIVRDK